MNRIDSLRPLVLGALVSLALAACATTGSSGGGSTATSSGGGGDPAKPAEQVTGRSMRMFEDTIAVYGEMKKSKVYDWEVLEKRFKAVIDADDRFAEAWFNLGVVYEHQRKPSEARRAYEKALDRKPSLKQAAENLAVMAQNEGRHADALAGYQEILRRYPDDGAARARLASIYRETGDVEHAMRYAREALMREPQNLTAYKVMMRVYLERNNLNMAKLVALRATRLAQDPELYYTMGLIALKEGDEGGAVLQFRTALKERDDFLAARIALADIAIKHGDWLNAGEQYRKIVQYDPKNVPARVNLGLAYRGLGQVDKAMAEFDQAIKADSRIAEPYYFLGVIFQKNKDAPEKAIEYYKRYISVAGAGAPDHPVHEAIRECEQYIRQLQEAKAEEERAKLEKAAAEERAKKEAEEKKREEEQKKREEAEKAKAEEEAKRQAEREKRQKDAKEAVDNALKAGEGGGEPKPAEGKPADKKPVEKKGEKKAEPKGGAKPEAKKEPPAEPRGAGDEPPDVQ